MGDVFLTFWFNVKHFCEQNKYTKKKEPGQRKSLFYVLVDFVTRYLSIRNTKITHKVEALKNSGVLDITTSECPELRGGFVG